MARPRTLALEVERHRLPRLAIEADGDLFAALLCEPAIEFVVADWHETEPSVPRRVERHLDEGGERQARARAAAMS